MGDILVHYKGAKQMTGTIKTINEKGYGFISEALTGKEYFFHRSGCITNFDNLTRGSKVVFVTVDSPKGPRAEDVRLS